MFIDTEKQELLVANTGFLTIYVSSRLDGELKWKRIPGKLAPLGIPGSLDEEFLKLHGGKPAGEFIKNLENEIENFMGEAPQADDVTAIMLHFNASA